jgi:hypothetical protein
MNPQMWLLLLGYKRNEYDSHHNKDEACRSHARRKKPDTKNYILNSISMRCPEYINP